MSRMEKYDNSVVKTRTHKNEKLYEQVGDISINYDYIDVNNAVEFDPADNNKSSREYYQKQKEINQILRKQVNNNVEVIEEETITKENRVYDINEILKSARSEVKNIENLNDKPGKRLINTEYNILTKLDIKKLDNENYRKEDLKSLIDDIYRKEKPKKMTNIKRNNDDNLLKDLLDDNNESDLMDDLNLKEELSKDILEKNKDDVGTVPITEEIKDLDEKKNQENKEIPESYHPNEDDNEMFLFDDIKKKKKRKSKKKDLEVNEIVKEESAKDDGIDYDNIDKDGRGLIVAIIIVVILIILTVLFFLYEYFFGA